MTEKRPDRTWRVGTVAFTFIEAIPLIRPVYMVGYKGAGECEIAYDPQCPLCRKEYADAQE